MAAALAGIGFAAALLAPMPAVFAAEVSPAVVARESVREPLRLAQAMPAHAVNDSGAIAVRSPGARNKAVIPVVVDSTADTGGLPGAPGTVTLRQALNFVSSNCNPYGPDTFAVNFNIAGAGPHTIATNIGFSVDCAGTVIDGYTQPGSSPNAVADARNGSNAVPQVVIDGSTMTGGNLFNIGSGASGSTVRGLVLKSAPTAGSALYNAAPSVLIGGNFIGTDHTGAACGSLNGPGVQLDFFATGTMVGSPSAADRNVIGCASPAIAVNGTTGVQIKGNLIGVGPDGLQPVGNSAGITTSNSFMSMTVGGQGTGEGNVIARNSGNGVTLFSNTSGIVVSGNDFFLNGLLGIDLGNDGPTPPNTNSFTFGPNGGQNYPVISSVTYSGGSTTIAGSLWGYSNAFTTNLEFFDNSTSALGLDEGQRYVDATSLFVSTAGNYPFSHVIPGIVRNPSATATAGSGTSELSPAFLTPDMSPSTTTLTFGMVPVGGSSATMPLTITNSGLGVLYIDAMSLSLGDYRDTTGGPPPSSLHWCGIGSSASGAPLAGPSAIPIPAGGNCVLNLVFAPQNSGARNATLTLVDAESPANGTVINLLGSGSVTPPTVNWTFNPVSVLQNAPSTLSLSITNSNGATFANPNFTHNLPANLVVAASPNASNPAGPSCVGSFATPTPGATSFTVNGLQVMTGATCTFSLDVSSGTVGSYPVSMAAGAIVGNVLGVPVSNAASNTATLTVNAPAAPAVQLTPGGLNFGNVTIGTTSPSQGVTLTNVGTAPLILGALSVTPGDFSQLSDCPVGPPGLSPSAFCTITADFTPTLAGTRSADITISSNATPPTNIVPLTGNGVTAPVPIASLTPSSLTFPTQSVGTTSAAQAVTLGNSGAAPLLISSIVSSGDFAQTNNCPPSLAPAGTCAISVTFSPIIAGTRSGDVKVFDNASGSPHIVTLSGTASAPPVPTVSAPSSVSFPATQVGGVSAPVTVTITNVGSGNLVVSAAQVVGSGYAITGDSCTGATVPLSGTCTITLTFSPGSAGSVIATLRLISNAPSSPTLVGLTGTGTAAPVGTLSATPASLDFGTQEIGIATAPRPVTVTNAGSGTVTVSGVTATGDYSQTNNCTTLAPAGTCTITVTFTPSATGPRPGSVSVASDASNAPLTVNLAGSGAPIQAPVIELSASSLTFGNRLVGAGAQVQSVTVRNKGGAPLAIGSFTLTGEFVQTNTCGTTVEPGGTCRVDVGFLPTIPGARFGKLTVTSNASNGTQFVDLGGTGCRFTFFNRTQSLICQ